MEELQRCNDFQGKNFVNSIDHSIFSKKNDNGDEEDNGNDDKSSNYDLEKSVVEDFEEDKSDLLNNSSH